MARVHPYPTPEGTGVNDYIYDVNLAPGRLTAMQALDKRSGWNDWNLVADQDCNVLQMVHAF